MLTNDCERKGCNFQPCRECIFNYCTIRTATRIIFFTDWGLQEYSIVTIFSYLKNAVNTWRSSYKSPLVLPQIIHLIKHAILFGHQTLHISQQCLSFKYPSHRKQHCRFCKNISTVHITTPAMRGKSNRNFYCYVLSTEDKLHLTHWIVSTCLNYSDNHKQDLFLIEIISEFCQHGLLTCFVQCPQQKHIITFHIIKWLAL